VDVFRLRVPDLFIMDADPELCTGCGACIEHCPASALSMGEDLPVADTQLCVTCFCCQEICPEKAMALR
jgi:ferredoxin